MEKYNFKDHIKVTRENGSQIHGHSPFREDKNPSFSANTESGLWTDHGIGEKGNYRQFLELLGLETDSSLHKPKKQNVYSASRRPLSVYFYRSVSGENLLKIERFENEEKKRFIARKWQKNTWVKGRPESLIPPMDFYKWNDTTTEVHFFEGEKSQQAAQKLFDKTQPGMIATCLPFGSNHKHEGVSQFFLGKKVIFHPDNDSNGIKYCMNLQKQLKDNGVDSIILNPISDAEKGDVFDWIEKKNSEGLTDTEVIKGFCKFKDDINNKLDIFKHSTSPFVSLDKVQSEKIDWLLKDLIVLGEVNSLAGEPGIGKSTALRSIVAGVTNGKSPLDGADIPVGKILMLSFEEDVAKVLKPTLKRFEADTSKIIAPGTFEDLNNLCENNEINDWLIDINPVLIVIDPIVAFKSEKTDMNSSSSVRSHIKVFHSWAKQSGAAVLFIQHFNKGLSGKATNRNSGSGDLTAGVRSELQIYQHPDKKDERILVQSKSNYSKLQDFGYSFKLSDGNIEWTGEASYTANQLALIEKMQASQDSSIKAILFLFRTLKDGPMESSSIFKRANDQQISERTLETAKAKVTTPERIGQKGKQGGGHTLIHLKDEYKPTPPDLRTKQLGGFKNENL